MKKRSVYFIVSTFIFLLSITSCQKNVNGIEQNSAQDKSVNAITNATSLSAFISRFEPNPVIAGDSTEVFVGLSKPAPEGGVFVTVNKTSSEGPVVDLPEIVFIPTGESKGSAFIHTLPFKDSILETVYATLLSFSFLDPSFLLIVPRPKSDPRPPLQLFEAEKAILKGAVAKKADVNSQVFFSNGAYAEFSSAKQAYALFNITPNRSGANVLEFRYAWRTSTNQQPQPLTVLVNGVQYSLLFPPTRNNTSNNLVYINANLVAGNNKIYVGTTTGNANYLRLDNLTVAVP